MRPLSDVKSLPHPTLIFDGECIMCSGFFKFLLHFDRAELLRFAVGQSPLGQGAYAHLGMTTQELESILFVQNGVIYTHANAVLRALAALGGIWRVFGWLCVIPDAIKNPVYNVVGRNRYRWFGRRDHCMFPDASVRARFVEGGF